MKIYTKVVMNIATGEITEADSFEHNGPISKCKGGGTTINSIDEAYNARMATIAEAQQQMAETYFKFGQEEYRPYESAMLQANMGLIPQETALRKQQIESEIGLMPMRTEAMRAQLGGAPAAIEQMYQSADVDIGDKMAQAQADVTQQFAGAQGQYERSLGRMGVAPGSGRSIGFQKDFALERAKGIAGARTWARRQGEEDRYRRLGDAARFGLGR